MKSLSKSIFISATVTAFFAWVVYMLMLPAMDFRSSSLYGFVTWVVIINATVFFTRDCIAGDADKPFFKRIYFIILMVVLSINFILAITNSAIVTSKTLQQISEVEKGNFTEDYVEISTNPAEAFTLDLDSAERLGNRAIGTIENASWYEVNSQFNLITYKGVKYRLSPLEYGGFFKYLKGKDAGIPGYVLVNDDTMEAIFVKTDNPIRFSPSAYFGKDLFRHLRSQFKMYTFTNPIFEIDEEGKPYWITGVTFPYASVYAGRIVEKVIVTDAFTGESKVYAVNEAPEWIDHIYGLNYLMDIAKWHYSYINGFWNTMFSQTGIYRTSYSYRYQRDDKDDDTANFFGYNSFINKKAETVFVTGITPANKSESNTGFITLNARTGQIIYYSAEGAEESTAQKSIEAKMQNFGYRATYPVFVNVNGQPTYLTALKDKAGIIQAYGFMNLKNYSITAVDKDIKIALSSYKQAMGIEVEEEASEEKESVVKEMTGTIEQIYTQAINGTTYYYYVVDGDLYKASATINEIQFLFEVGDEIEIKYQDATEFRNVILITRK